MENIEPTFDWLLRVAGSMGLSIYAVIMILWSLLVTGLDNKGTYEAHIQGWDEFAFMGYGLFVVGVLFWLSWRVIFCEKTFGPKFLLFPVVVFAFHVIVVVIRAVDEALIYLTVSQLPLLAGILFLGCYIWRNGEKAPNKAPKPTQ